MSGGINWAELWPLLRQGTLETLLMVAPAALIAEGLGLALGVLLTLTRPGGLQPNAVVHRVLDAAVNIGRSLPFIILLVVLIPVTRLLTGTSIGSVAAIVPLTVAAIPFVARLVDGALRDVPAGVTEAARAMGASNAQIVRKVLLQAFINVQATLQLWYQRKRRHRVKWDKKLTRKVFV